MKMMPETLPTTTPVTTTPAVPLLSETPVEANALVTFEDDYTDPKDIDLAIFDVPSEEAPTTTEKPLAIVDKPVTPATTTPTTTPALTPELAATTVPAEVVTPAAPATPVAPVEAPDPIALYQQFRNTAIETLAKGYYGLDPKVIEEITADPEAGMIRLLDEVPKLMARVYVDAVTCATNVLLSHLPQAVVNIGEARDQAKQNETDFYGQWPGLKEHAKRAAEIGVSYRQQHPTLSREQFIRDVGALTVLAVGLTPEQATAGRVVTPPVSSAQPPVRHRPPAAGARPLSGVAEANEFTRLADEPMDER